MIQQSLEFFFNFFLGIRLIRKFVSVRRIIQYEAEKLNARIVFSPQSITIMKVQTAWHLDEKMACMLSKGHE